LNFVPYNLHGLAQGYLVSEASLDAAAGAILAGPASDHFGRKKLLIADAGIYAGGTGPRAGSPARSRASTGRGTR
jgi:SP family arabinose:H+ symporter-like MFS transporter